MFAQVRCPETLEAEELDAYLEQGWFRMGQTIFTTNFLQFKNQVYSAIWLRVSLKDFSADKTQQKLTKRNSAFRTEIKPAAITFEKEKLYSNYKQHISFEASESLSHLMFRNSVQDIFNTREINIYDDDKLIATGFFDIGKNSAAGIASFYDHAYKKYSLGKYLIYLKMAYCKQLNLRYFYPGYFVPGYSFFDYKLAIGKPALNYLQLQDQKWITIDKFSSESIPVSIMQNRLNALHKLLSQLRVKSKVLPYSFFDANLIPDLRDAEVFDFPLLLFSSDHAADNVSPIIVFDVRDGLFHLMKCYSVWTPNPPNLAEEFYSIHLLKIEQDLFSTDVAEEMAEVFCRQLSIH